MQHLRYKTFIQRAGALLVDGIVLAVASYLFDFIFDIDIYDWYVVSQFVIIIYRVIAHWQFGQTIGKWALNIKVVQSADENQLPTINQSFMREIASIGLLVIGFFPRMPEQVYTVLSLCWLVAELVCISRSKQQRSVHDLIGSTVVIDIKQYSDWEKKYYYGKPNA